jgi:hypothetical protein
MVLRTLLYYFTVTITARDDCTWGVLSTLGFGVISVNHLHATLHMCNLESPVL